MSLELKPSSLRAEIAQVHARLFAEAAQFLRQTPLMKLSGPSLGLPCAEVWLKLEHMQVEGSFKARGMLNRLISNPIGDAGVIVASGGNAGIATAAAAQHLGVRCEVFLPAVSSPAKRERLKDLGAHVTIAGEVYADALAACVQRQAQTGALMTHAYDQPEVMLGAGSLGAEIEAQAGGVPDQLLVSVGGGGLLAGLAAWFEDRCGIHALEPERAPTLHAARHAGQPVDVAVSGIAADALGAKRIGNLGWQQAQRWVKHSHLLTDESIQAAQQQMWQTLRIAAEPAAALPWAALATGVVAATPNSRVCLVVCGGNVDLAGLAGHSQ